MAPRSDHEICRRQEELAIEETQSATGLLENLELVVGRIMAKPLDTINSLVEAVEKKDTYEMVKLRVIVAADSDDNDNDNVSSKTFNAIDKICTELYRHYLPNNKIVCNITMFYIYMSAIKLRNELLDALLCYWTMKMKCETVWDWQLPDLCENIVTLYPQYFEPL